MKRFITAILIMSMVVSLLGMSGCSTNQKKDTRIIVDCSGAEVEIPNEINTVICVNQPFSEFMIAMGLGDKIIGSHGSVIGHSWAPYFYDKITSIEMYGYKPEAELLYEADADLVVVKSKTYAETLRNEGIPAIYFGYNNIEELYYAVDLLGEIFGDEAKAYIDTWKDYLQTTIDDISNDLSTLKPEDRKNVYYINASINPCTLYSTFGGNSFVEYWMNSIGANLVTSKFEDIEEIDQEVAISLNPDTIIISGYAEYTVKDELVSDPLWTNIDAVKNRNIYLMPTSLVSYERFAVELPMLLEYSANILYPELHSFDAISEIKEFNKKFYGIEFSDEEIELMIQGLDPDGTRMDD